MKGERALAFMLMLSATSKVKSEALAQFAERAAETRPFLEEVTDRIIADAIHRDLRRRCGAVSAREHAERAFARRAPGAWPTVGPW